MKNIPPFPQEYFETRFVIPTSAAEISWPKKFAIITAWATTGQNWSEERNLAADRRLRQRLTNLEVWHCRVTGTSADLVSHVEPGWAAELDFDAACDLGTDFLQLAIYYIVADMLYLSYCDCRLRKLTQVGGFRSRLKPGTTV